MMDMHNRQSTLSLDATVYNSTTANGDGGQRYSDSRIETQGMLQSHNCGNQVIDVHRDGSVENGESCVTIT